MAETPETGSDAKPTTIYHSITNNKRSYTMSTLQTPITVSMLSEYIGQHSAASYSALALLAEILNGEIDLEQIRLDVLAETQP